MLINWLSLKRLKIRPEVKKQPRLIVSQKASPNIHVPSVTKTAHRVPFNVEYVIIGIIVHVQTYQ